MYTLRTLGFKHLRVLGFRVYIGVILGLYRILGLRVLGYPEPYSISLKWNYGI